jgi:hypothetical protein
VKAAPGKKGSPTKKKKRVSDNVDEEDNDYGLKDGQEIAGIIVQAPKTGRGAWTSFCLAITVTC